MSPAFESTQQPVLDWCLPVVHDCLYEFYARRLPEGGGALKMLARRHFFLWVALIQDPDSCLDNEKLQLEAQARTLRIEETACRAADRYVAAEILDLSLRRFRRMPGEARIANAALLAVLMRLQPERPFVAQASGFAPAPLARAA